MMVITTTAGVLTPVLTAHTQLDAETTEEEEEEVLWAEGGAPSWCDNQIRQKLRPSDGL